MRSARKTSPIPPCAILFLIYTHQSVPGWGTHHRTAATRFFRESGASHPCPWRGYQPAVPAPERVGASRIRTPEWSPTSALLHRRALGPCTWFAVSTAYSQDVTYYCFSP